jgi:anhydro-N-acetylmuramic acid kinase
VAQTCGLPVVADFRQADVAACGEGAPLTPAFDYLLLHRSGEDVLTLNLGGIANVTLVPASGRPEEVVGFDVGPCNLLLDGLARQLLGRAMDRDGRVAARGRVHPGEVDRLLEDPFLEKVPPRSTGRERYGRAYVTTLVRRWRRRGWEPADALATAAAFVAEAVGCALERFVLPRCRPRRVLASGGGWWHRPLRRALAERLGRLGLALLPFSAGGLGPREKEAGLFAWLANEAVCGRPAHLPQVTGASEARVLGSLHL